MKSNTRASRRRITPFIAAAGVAALVFSGCSSPGAAPSAAGGQAPQARAPQAPMLAPDADKGATGDIVFCGGKDTGIREATAKRFNAMQSAIRVSYLELGADTSAARTAAIQRLEGGSTDCDIYMTDVVWTPEWAQQGWLYDQTDLVKAVGGEIIPSILSTTEYDGRNWAMPFYTDSALIYYRTDRVKAPTSWKDLYAQAAADPEHKLLLQAKAYEGLTVNFLELLYSAGGSVIDEQGKVVIDSPQARTALTFMRDGFKNGSIDPASLTYDETGVRRAYESGLGGFQRNWPGAWNGTQASEAGPKTAVAPLPSFDGTGKPAGVLGGWNLAVAQKAKNPGASVAFIKYVASEEAQRQMVLETAQSPIRAALYSDPEVVAKIPFAPQLKTSLENAKPRPKSPVYAQISRAIYENVYAVLSEGSDVDAAIKKMADEIQKAQETF
ncbi:MAG: ABC transporter substrate-binding protein [Propioniciclava sp.]|uniref:ABC transporter substrate-binding protein n=1 Tax=Propioniciclava sp. TaxID=2038686 RepID=UPI0039E4B8F2